MPSSPVSPPAAVEQLYALWIWVEGRVHDFPTQARHGLGRRLVDAVLDALEQLTRASYAVKGSHTRRESLDAANQRLAFARLLLRGARDLKLLSLDQHAHAVEGIVEVGRAVGAWLKAEAAR